MRFISKNESTENVMLSSAAIKEQNADDADDSDKEKCFNP